MEDLNFVEQTQLEIGYRTAAAILVPQFMPIWDFAELYAAAGLQAHDSSQMMEIATTWARRLAEGIEKARAIKEIGRVTAEGILVPDFFDSVEFAKRWKTAKLEAPDAETMQTIAAQWAGLVIAELPTPPTRPPETLPELGFRIAFALVYEKTGLPCWEAHERFQMAEIEANTPAEMEEKARAWAEVLIGELTNVGKAS
jgi:hypothetical protein